ncbi:MAG: site-specific integrase [Clostridia bacterium]|nr:site-specific integrase [Clostridia bacterium]MBQ8525337.1 site-specific integrase [Clostridia bacterium]
MARKRANGEGSIKQRKNGTWEGQYSLDGKRKSVYGKTQAEVKTKLRNILTEIENNTYSEQGKMLFTDWLKEWLEVYAKPNVKPSTFDSYHGYVYKHIIPWFPKVAIKDLRADTLQRFLNDKLKSGRLDKIKNPETGKLETRPGGLSEKTIKNIYNMVHAALKQAYINGITQRNIADMVKPPKQKRKEIDVFTLEEQEKIIRTVKGSHERLAFGITLALFTGIRAGELSGLKWEDIDFEKSEMKIRRTLNRVGSHDGVSKTKIVIGEPKSERSKRTIPLQGFILAMLKQWKIRQIWEQKRAGELYNDDGYVLANEFGGYVENRTYRDTYTKILQEAEVRYLHFHCLRHTFATRALEAGFDIKALSDILGHADASTTLNRYGHALPDHKRAAMEKLNFLYKEA